MWQYSDFDMTLGNIDKAAQAMTNNTTRICRVSIATAAMLAEPHDQSVCTSEALYGELVTILESYGEWVKARLHTDGYEGYMRRQQLSEQSETQPFSAATHWVQQRSTLLFSKPDFKSPLMHRIPFGSELVLHESDHETFSPTECGFFVFTAHCLPLKQLYPQNPLTLAQSHFLGAPYRWGGRSPQGADCSGLVQLLARSQGLVIPRDSGDQEAFIKTNVNVNDCRALDLVYWSGHTGILLTPDTLLHATAYTMDCRIESLQQVSDRAGPPSSVKRLFHVQT